MAVDEPHRRTVDPSPQPPADPAPARPSLSADSMNTFVARHRDGTWCVWTAADGEDRVVSRHATREQAERAAGTIPG